MIRGVGRLHLVTDSGIDPATIVHMIGEAARTGVDVVHVRYPRLGARTQFRLVGAIQEEISGSGTRIVVNDRVDVAIASGADGVHLGRRSLGVREVRRLVGRDMIIGVSVHNAGEARDAAIGGADYLVFGHVYPTPSHPGEPGRGVEQLTEVVQAGTSTPVIAIGGITAACIPEVLDAGASGVAVIRAILASDDIASATWTLAHSIRRHAVSHAQGELP